MIFLLIIEKEKVWSDESCATIVAHNYSFDKFFLILVKRVRAAGGCLGIRRRRRTRIPAKSSGELDKSIDPEESEWGNPVGVIFHHFLLNK